MSSMGIQIKMSFTLEMTDKQLESWANEYGLDVAEAAQDATEHLAALVQVQIETMSHVENFAKVTGFKVRN